MVTSLQPYCRGVEDHTHTSASEPIEQATTVLGSKQSRLLPHPHPRVHGEQVAQHSKLRKCRQILRAKMPTGSASAEDAQTSGKRERTSREAAESVNSEKNLRTVGDCF